MLSTRIVTELLLWLCCMRGREIVTWRKLQRPGTARALCERVALAG